MKRIIIMVSTMLLIILAAGCGTIAASPVIKTITVKNSTEENEYSIIYDNGKKETVDEFIPDDALFLYVDNEDFSSNIRNGRVHVGLEATKLTDSDGNIYDADEMLQTIMQCIADSAEHEIFDVTIIIYEGGYYVFEKHNVNIQTPCVLYEYDTATMVLNELCRWNDVDLKGISICKSDSEGSTEIIGGSDGPTSIYLAPQMELEGEKEQGIDDSEYTAVIDRVLNEYNFEPVDWNNTIEWSEDADVLIKMAEENKGRYKAYGIISKEAGSYGIVLIDTVDWTEINTNYVFEKWYYTASPDGEPELRWDKSRLYFAYPVPSIIGYRMKTVMIDCGYDTGHMEFVE